MNHTDARTSVVRYPLIAVDRSRDPDRYDSGWLRLYGPAELGQLPAGPAVTVWDGAGRPVRMTASGVVLQSDAPDPAVREILNDWRQRMPVPLMTGGPAGDTAIPFMVSDVLAARSRLTPEGATARPSGMRRVLPIVLMLLAAVMLFPLVRLDSWWVAVVALCYWVASTLLRRWSYPPEWWGNPPRRDDPDVIAKAAFASKAAFWGVAAAAGSLAVLDWAGTIPWFLPWT